MSTKMNSKTHKIITATYYPAERQFVVPIDWDIEDISVKYDQVYYKKEFQEVPVYEMETDEKYPEKIEEGDWEDLAGYFSCCESEEEEESSEEEQEEREYTIEIQVCGLGYCRYYDKEDRDKYVVYCKNGVWKMKGDKTARDMEGNLCETESEEEEEEEDKHECELCKKLVEETEYLPSKEDEEKQQILGNDYCLECYKKVEKFEFVENIDLDK
jgi:hypothetical protein